MARDATHVRKANTITELATGKKTRHKYINEAKRASRAIQIAADGAIGRGSVQVETRKNGRK